MSRKTAFGGHLWTGQDKNQMAPQGPSCLHSWCSGPQSSVARTVEGTILFRLS